MEDLPSGEPGSIILESPLDRRTVSGYLTPSQFQNRAARLGARRQTEARPRGDVMRGSRHHLTGKGNIMGRKPVLGLVGLCVGLALTGCKDCGCGWRRSSRKDDGTAI